MIVIQAALLLIYLISSVSFLVKINNLKMQGKVFELLLKAVFMLYLFADG